MVKEYDYFKFRQPYQQVMYYSSLILEDNPWLGSEKLEALVHLVPEDLLKFSHLLLSMTFFECHAAGNIGPSEVETLVIDIDKLFYIPEQISKTLFASQFLTNRIVKLQTARSHFYPVDPNVLVLHTKPELIVLVAKQPVFHQPRTVVQLGYIVILMQRNHSGIQGLQFIIQSTVKDPGRLDERPEAFLEMFDDKLYALSLEEFEISQGKEKVYSIRIPSRKKLPDGTDLNWYKSCSNRFTRLNSGEVPRPTASEYYPLVIEVADAQTDSVLRQLYVTPGNPIRGAQHLPKLIGDHA
ncbi:Zinc-metallopeptidase [Nymphaea thermarum]|nr:Zinc-metallopeptidase [Nymphaea thermarum]